MQDDLPQGLDSRGGPNSGSRVFLPGEEKVSDTVLRNVSPDEILGGHRSAARVSDALIMMVDDELLNIEMTQAFLEEAGYRRFVSTHESEKAVAMMRAQPPSVLLLDLSMPKVSGMDILEAMRDDPVLRHVPAIVLTSTTDSPVKLQALSNGAMDFLSKPVDPSELALRIRNTLAATAYRDFLARHDALTGLPNKSGYREAVTAGLQAARERGEAGAVVHVGVDHLARINDALGHAVGDQVLQRLAKLLAGCVATEAGGGLSSETDNPTLYRFDGDEFAILVPHMDDIETTAGFIAKLLDTAATSINRGGKEMFVTCSIGVAVFPQDGREAAELASNAALAMRHAKESGRHTYEFFSPELNARAVEKLELGADFSKAMARGELEVRYQPRIDVVSGHLMAAEAIVRWNRKNDVLEGDALLQLAATPEMSMALTAWTLDQLMQHTREWRAQGYPVVPVGVNVSLKQLPIAQLMDAVTNAIRAGLQPQALCLELHEASTLDSRQEDVDALMRLKKMGVRLALDHFGSGHSSLVQLRRFPVDEIKVDPLFFEKIESNRDNAAIVSAMIAMAAALELVFVATGIATLHQLAFLKAKRCGQCQGKLFNLPLSALEFAGKWLMPDRQPQPR